MARLKFSQGGDAGITRIAVICSMVANGCGATLYGLLMLACFYLGFNIGGINHPAFTAAGTIFIFVGLIFLPIVLVFVSQLVAGCPALKQCEDLRGGNGSKRNYQMNQNQSVSYNQGY
jgi:hypothetical protein